MHTHQYHAVTYIICKLTKFSLSSSLSVRVIQLKNEPISLTIYKLVHASLAWPDLLFSEGVITCRLQAIRPSKNRGLAMRDYKYTLA